MNQVSKSQWGRIIRGGRRAVLPAIAVSVALFAVAVFLGGCGEEPAAHTPGMHDSATGDVVETGQKTCPVMGGAISKDFYADHEGRRIYFCCASCVETFKKDPEKYVAKVDAELKKEAEAAD